VKLGSYSSTQGRFISVDPENYQAMLDPSDPQSWNAYSHTNGNPLRRIDPNGKGFWDRFLNILSGYGNITNKEKREKLARAREHLKALEAKFGGLYDKSNLNGDVKRIDVDSLKGHDLFDWDRNFTKAGADNYPTMSAEDPDEHVSGLVFNEPVPSRLQRFMVAVTVTPLDMAGGLPIDPTGKVHGNLPDRVPDDWTREELENSADSLRKSIETRKQQQIDKGEDGPHRSRINEEERLLRQIEKKLSGS
jgi:hypothetical protein